jgi:hypothetical protein
VLKLPALEAAWQQEEWDRLGPKADLAPDGLAFRPADCDPQLGTLGPELPAVADTGDRVRLGTRSTEISICSSPIPNGEAGRADTRMATGDKADVEDQLEGQGFVEGVADMGKTKHIVTEHDEEESLVQ